MSEYRKATGAAGSVTPEALQPLDMARERAACSFDVDAMTCVFAGTRHARDRSRWLMSLLQQHPDNVFDKSEVPFMGRTERFMRGQRIALAYFELRNKFGLPKEDRDQLRLYLDEYITLQVHESMGHPTTQNQSSDEQWAAWGPNIASGRWLLCYAQTEMAHGSNLNGLRTTATFCPDTDEWDIHTPEPSAGKLWIGGSGSTATHALLMANVYINAKSYGMHPFLMPLRDPDSHVLLQGRTAIDMGPKKGAPSMDNGYLTFTHARIPRTNMLARFQTVDKGGTYSVRNQQGKLLIRGTMTLVRVGLCEIAAHHAARASLIAVRYALVRRQGGGGGGGGGGLERQIIDYPGVQQRLLTGVASAYALTFAARHLRSIYNQLQFELQARGNSDLLRIVHGYTSVLKAVMTDESYCVVWRCRKSMGGLGFSAASGLTDLENNQPDANLTYEGDNNMLLGGPAANFLVKELARVVEQRQAPSRPELAYLEHRPSTTDAKAPVEDDALLDAHQQLAIVGRRAARLVYALYDLRSSKTNSIETAYLDARLAMRASRAHGAYFVLFAFVHTIEALRRPRATAAVGAPLSSALLDALDRVRSLYALDICILDNVADYTEDGYMGVTAVQAVQRQNARLMAAIRPDVLGLVEAADMNDWYLASPLGSSDGRAYERMLAFMQREPLNRRGDDGGRDARGVLHGFRSTIGRLTHGEVPAWNEGEAQKRESERQKERMTKL